MPKTRPRTPSPARRWTTAALLAASLGTPAFGQAADPVPVVELPPAPAAVNTTATVTTNADANLEGYDYGHVFNIFATAVIPAKTHMGATVKQFDLTMEQTQQMIDRGDHRGAVRHALATIEQMMVLRDQVVEPLLEGRDQMAKAMEPLRRKLVKAAAEAGVETGEGLDALPPHTRDQLRRLAERHEAATSDRQRRSLERNFRSLYRSAKMQSQIRALAPRAQAAQRKMLSRLGTMLDAMDELASATAYAFNTLNTHRQILESYREILNVTENLKKAEELLRQSLGGTGGLGESIQQIDTGLEEINLAIGDEIDAVLVQFDDTLENEGIAQIGLPPNQSTLDLMDQLRASSN